MSQVANCHFTSGCCGGWMSAEESLTLGSGNEQQESVKVRAISFKNGKEIKRKIYSVQSTNHLLEVTGDTGEPPSSCL
ncbi:hypothetical protein F7725_025777 [Dissostichus mawsoni]|uniref:Uncharacterized protein n=1 Tax=Dissostichus mawsoni TaxID=36200 RepID=A0A7J5X581_DISMA|nr:hypothetical protein F7725_025777 [Dissostichus mawsoni]